MPGRQRRIRSTRDISIRTLARKDAEDVRRTELQSEMARLFKEANFRVVILPDRTVPRLAAHGKDYLKDEWRVEVATLSVVTVDGIKRAIGRKRNAKIAEYVNELWIVGDELSDDATHLRDTLPGGVRAMTLEEATLGLRRRIHFGRKMLPKKRKAPAAIRTKIGKSVVANTEELRTAAVTSILLIEDRLEALRHEKPNSDESIAKRDDEIKKLTVMKGQLETIHNLPEEVKKGEVTDAQVNKSVRSFAEGVRDYWNAHHETICSRGFNAAIFASVVLVCKLAGASGDVSIAISTIVTGTTPMIEGIRKLGRKLFK